MTDITREAVEARVALLRSDYAADGAAFDANMLLALLVRAETAERERDELDGRLSGACKTIVDVVIERDRLAGELAEARRMMDWNATLFEEASLKVTQHAIELAAARNKIEGMRELLTEVAEVEMFDAMMSGPVHKGFNHSALVRVMPKVRTALDQANKTEGKHEQ